MRYLQRARPCGHAMVDEEARYRIDRELTTETRVLFFALSHPPALSAESHRHVCLVWSVLEGGYRRVWASAEHGPASCVYLGRGEGRRVSWRLSLLPLAM